MAVSLLSLTRPSCGPEEEEVLEGAMLWLMGHGTLSVQEGAWSPAQEGYRMMLSLWLRTSPPVFLSAPSECLVSEHHWASHLQVSLWAPWRE